MPHMHEALGLIPATEVLVISALRRWRYEIKVQGQPQLPVK